MCRLHKLGALGFLLALLTPATVQLLSGGAGVSIGEKRVLEPMPAWPGQWSGWSAFSGNLERFLRDHFGLREHLTTGWNLLKYALRYNRRVAIGRDGWLYYSQYWKSRYGAPSCGPSSADARSFADRLDRLAAHAAAGNVPVLFAIAPNKETIYPEYMPGQLGALGHCDLYSELMLALGSKRHVKVLDLRPLLKAWKAKERVYFKTDTHWSDIGFWRVSRALLEGVCPAGSLCPRLPEPSLSTKTCSGDLAQFLGLSSILTEQYQAVDFPASQYSREVANDHPAGGQFNTEQWVREGRTGRTLYVVGDSFAKIALRFLIADESVARVIWSYHREGGIDFQPIVAAKPDAILIVIVERALYDPGLLRSFAADFPE
ncbi:MAG TPA: hypothetical protein VK572_05305 [Burkholderiales bacterium]|nr:hypothetical protein [Burkholderiales bacterium]